MAAPFRHRNPGKLPILLLVFLLCVQSISYASHSVMANTATQATEQLVTKQITAACHDMPDITDTETTIVDNTHSPMPCCDDGQCADANCMMPTGTHFTAAVRDYFVAYRGDVLIARTGSSQSVKPSPPTRPPIA